MKSVLPVVIVALLVAGVCYTGEQEKDQEQRAIPGVDTEPLLVIPPTMRLEYPSKSDRELRLMLHEGQERMKQQFRDMMNYRREPADNQPEEKPNGKANVLGGLAEGEFWPAPEKDAAPFTVTIHSAGQGKVYYLVYQYSAGRWRYRGQPKIVHMPQPTAEALNQR